MNPLFSIITVTYNASAVLPPTLDSVKAQTFSNFEHLVVDGASSDNTVSLAKLSGIGQMSIVSEPDKGLYDAMNKGIRLAKGDFLIFLNAGDSFAANDVLARLAEKAVEGVDVVYGQTQVVNASRDIIGMRHLTAPEVLTADCFKHGMLVCHQAFVARRSFVPFYDLTFHYSADYDWCIKCLQKSRCNAYVGEVPIISFLTDGMTDKYHKASLMERFHIMCKWYGTVPTVLRHLSFIPRYLKKRLNKKTH